MGTFIVGILVVGIAALAVRSMRRDKKKGNACGGSCASCQGCGKKYNKI